MWTSGGANDVNPYDFAFPVTWTITMPVGVERVVTRRRQSSIVDPEAPGTPHRQAELVEDRPRALRIRTPVSPPWRSVAVTVYPAAW